MIGAAWWLPNAVAITEHRGAYRKQAAEYVIGLSRAELFALTQLLDLQALETLNMSEALKDAAAAIYDAEAHAIAARRNQIADHLKTAYPTRAEALTVYEDLEGNDHIV